MADSKKKAKEICGFMWFDDTKGRPQAYKIERAKSKFIAKFSRQPSLAHVHDEDESAKDGASVAGLRVVVSPKHIQPNTVWIV